MKWKKKVSTILSLFFISSLMLLSFGYAISSTSNDVNQQNNGLADSPWPRYRGNNQGTGLSPYNTSFVRSVHLTISIPIFNNFYKYTIFI
ncbi:MAG: hypothetical protein ACOC40_00830 [Thermoplasmatota archaeon]